MGSAMVERLPRLGLGGAALGNLYRAIGDEQAAATVHAALESGMRLIDTAPYYGHGRSEARIGAALKAWRGERPLISTKVGRVLDPSADPGDFGFADPLPFRPRFDYSRDGVRRGLEGSLARLGVEKIDIALIHDIGAQTHGKRHAGVFPRVLDEALPELHDARAQGLIGLIGIGVNEWEVCVELLSRADLDIILLAGRHTLLEQPASESGMLDLCAARGVQVMAGGVFNSGLLAAPPSPSSRYNYEPAPESMIERAGHVWAICERFGVAPQAAALQFPLAHPAVSTVLAGAASAMEAADAALWMNMTVPGALWTELKRAGLIAETAPVPSEGIIRDAFA